MANTLRFKRGLLAGLPSAAVGEPLFTTDTFDLYIGTASGTQKYQKFIASGTTSQLLRGDGSLLTMPIVLTSPANGEVLKYNGTNWVNSADAGVTGSGIAGQVTYWGSASTITGSNNLFWDATNSRLGIGTTAPASSLHVLSTATIPARFISSGATTQVILDNTNANLWGSNLDIRVNGNTQFNFGTLGSLLGNTTYDATVYARAGNGFRVNVNNSATTSFFVNSAGNTLVNSTTDNGLRFQVTGDGYFSGSVGIGSTTLTQYNLRVSKNITGATVAYGIVSDGVIQSDVTSSGLFFSTLANTQNATFTLNNLFHFSARQGTFGASSTITKQVGFFVESSVVGAGTNVGFESNIAAGTGRWNLYMSGTANNYMAGSLGIGSAALTGYALRLSKTITGSVNAVGLYIDGAVQNDVTSQARGLQISPTIASGTAFSDLIYYFARQNTFTGTATNQYAVFVDSNLTGATNNYAFYSNLASGTGRWNLYMNGTADNYLAGNLGVGTTNPLEKLVVSDAGARGIHFNPNGTGNRGYIYSYNRSTSAYYGLNIEASDLKLRTGSATIVDAMTVFSSGNVLIQTAGTATDAGFKLDVNGTMRVSGATTLGDTSSVTLNITGGRAIRISGSLFMDYATGGTGDFIFRSGAGFTERMRLDASGNLGLGVTPSAWSGLKALQVGATASLAGFTPSGDGAYLSSNAFFNGTSWIYQTTATSSQYVQISGQHRWFSASSGTAGNAITFTEAMRLDASGNLAIGTTTTTNRLEVWGSGNTAARIVGQSAGNATLILSSGGVTAYSIKSGNGDSSLRIDQDGTERIMLASGGNLLIGTTTNSTFKLDVNGTMRVSGASTLSGAVTMNASVSGNNPILELSNSNTLALEFTDLAQAANNRKWQFNVNSGIFFFRAFNDARSSFTEIMQFTRTGAATFSSSVTAGARYIVSAASSAGISDISYGSLSGGAWINTPSATNGYLAVAGNAALRWSASELNFYVSAAEAMRLDANGFGIGGVPAQKLDVQGSANSIQARFGNVAGRGLTIGTSAISGTNDAGVVFNAPTATDGTLVFQTSSTDRMTLNSSGLNVATAIAIGTTPDTNLPFKILKNINSTVGIRFENTSTGASSFTGYQFGTDVSGGTAFTNFLYASSGVTETGVYKPNGTALINTGSGGLNFLAVSQPIRFFTSTGNGTERVRIKNEGHVRFVPLAAAPTTNVEAGDVYYDSTTNKLRCYNGTTWNDLF